MAKRQIDWPARRIFVTDLPSVYKMEYDRIIYHWIFLLRCTKEGTMSNWNCESRSRGDALFVVRVIVSHIMLFALDVSLETGDRRGILITSFVSLVSLHSLMRTNGQKRELIGDPEKREEREIARLGKSACYFYNKKTPMSAQFHKYRRAAI